MLKDTFILAGSHLSGCWQLLGLAVLDSLLGLVSTKFSFSINAGFRRSVDTVKSRLFRRMVQNMVVRKAFWHNPRGEIRECRSVSLCERMCCHDGGVQLVLALTCTCLLWNFQQIFVCYLARARCWTIRLANVGSDLKQVRSPNMAVGKISVYLDTLRQL